jgi:hypothetical protein
LNDIPTDPSRGKIEGIKKPIYDNTKEQTASDKNLSIREASISEDKSNKDFKIELKEGDSLG